MGFLRHMYSIDFLRCFFPTIYLSTFNSLVFNSQLYFDSMCISHAAWWIGYRSAGIQRWLSWGLIHFTLYEHCRKNIYIAIILLWQRYCRMDCACAVFVFNVIWQRNGEYESQAASGILIGISWNSKRTFCRTQLRQLNNKDELVKSMQHVYLESNISFENLAVLIFHRIMYLSAIS